MSQRWLITGCSRGLGRALAEAVLQAGHRLVATARDPAPLADLAQRHGDAVRLATLDVADADAADAAVRLAGQAFGGLDVLVNNAGYGNVNSVEDTTLDDFRRQIETNLFGTIIVTKAAIPLMRRQRSGHIIQFSSVGGRLGARREGHPRAGRPRTPAAAAGAGQRRHGRHRAGRPRPPGRAGAMARAERLHRFPGARPSVR
jgi:NAD(P)-dependent dehydrogenase (short-subunit alcohol dehydrogenase family)